jgi:hypothetical protein
VKIHFFENSFVFNIGGGGLGGGDSAVGIATGYGLEGSEFESR